MAMKGLFTVEMGLRDMLYVSYLLPAERLRPLLPTPLEPACVESDTVFVSLVAFRGTTTAISVLPSPRFHFDPLLSKITQDFTRPPYRTTLLDG